VAAGLSAREVADVVGVSARSVERSENRDVRKTTYQRQMSAVVSLLTDRLAEVQRLQASG
jgi:hypothetical protein